MAAGDVVHAIGEPAMVYMALDDTLREAISMSLLELEGGVDIILESCTTSRSYTAWGRWWQRGRTAQCEFLWSD